MSAATAATCGAEAEVPKKFGKPSGSVVPGTSKLRSKKKNDVLPPSGPVTPGLMRTSGVGRRWPLDPKNTGVPPADEKELRQAGMHCGRSGLPHSSVWYQAAAPTASAPAAFAWPNTVPLAVSYSSTLNAPASRSNHTYLM